MKFKLSVKNADLMNEMIERMYVEHTNISHDEEISPENFKDAMSDLQDKELEQTVNSRFKQIEEFFPGIDHKVPMFITDDGSIPKKEDIKTGDQAVFLGSLHTVDDRGYLVDDEDGLLASQGGFHCKAGDPLCSPYVFDGSEQ